MRTRFTIDIRDITLAILSVLMAYQFLSPPRKDTVTEKRTTQVDIKKEVEEAVNDRLQLQRPEVQPTIVYQDRVVPIYRDTPVPKEDRDKVMDLNRYRDTTRLKNATIYSDILSDGTVYRNKVTAEVDVRTVTNTIERETVKHATGLFISPEMDLGPDTGAWNMGASLNYFHKGGLGIGIGARYDLKYRGVSYGIRLHKKLF